MKFRDMTQAELIEHVKAFDGIHSHGEKAEAFNWVVRYISVEEVVEKSQYDTGKEGWIEWIGEEQKERLAEWGYDSIQQIADYWLARPEQEPIIACWTSEGNLAVLDGYHRFGLAVQANRVSVPMILGESINEE